MDTVKLDTWKMSEHLSTVALLYHFQVSKKLLEHNSIKAGHFYVLLITTGEILAHV